MTILVQGLYEPFGSTGEQRSGNDHISSELL